MQHPNDDALVGLYFASQDETSDAAAEHLISCDACAERYAELARALDDTRAAGSAEADEIFTDGRLDAQRDHILRRIEHLGQRARILLFPARMATRALPSSAARGATRWVATAAAAGLMVGVAAGWFLDLERHRTGATPQIARRAAPGSPAVVPVRPAPHDEDALLLEIEAAVGRSAVDELRVLDDLTPRFREAAVILR